MGLVARTDSGLSSFAQWIKCNVLLSMICGDKVPFHEPLEKPLVGTPLLQQPVESLLYNSHCGIQPIFFEILNIRCTYMLTHWPQVQYSFLTEVCMSAKFMTHSFHCSGCNDIHYPLAVVRDVFVLDSVCVSVCVVSEPPSLPAIISGINLETSGAACTSSDSTLLQSNIPRMRSGAKTILGRLLIHSL